MTAKRLTDRSNDAHLAPSPFQTPAARRLRRIGRRIDRLQIELPAQTFQNLPTGDDQPFLPGTAGIQRHEFDEAQAQILFCRETDQIRDLVVVHPADDHRIDLHRMETQFPGQADSRENTFQPVPPGHPSEVVPVQRVHAEADPVQPGLAQGGGLGSEQRPVGGHGQVADAGNLRQRSNQLVHSVPQQGLTAGDADLLDPQADGNSDHPGDLLETEDLRLGFPFPVDGGGRGACRGWVPQAVVAGAVEIRGLLGFRQAVQAAEIAAVGHADPKVPHDSSVGVPQLSVH